MSIHPDPIFNHHRIQQLYHHILSHPVFNSLISLDHLRRFSEIHVYAVWDFMVLLKALRRRLIPDQPLWLPPMDAIGAHLVNTLVAEEESDQLPDGRCLSHFELYLAAMEQIGANTQAIKTYLEYIREYHQWETVQQRSDPPQTARIFINDTWHITQLEGHCIAASLAYAREHITEGMFSQILERFEHEPSASLFIDYFQRHMDLDGGHHSEQSTQLVANLCGLDSKKWQQALDSAIFSLESRVRLLDGIYEYMMT